MNNQAGIRELKERNCAVGRLMNASDVEAYIIQRHEEYELVIHSKSGVTELDYHSHSFFSKDIEPLLAEAKELFLNEIKISLDLSTLDS